MCKTGGRGIIGMPYVMSDPALDDPSKVLAR